MSHIRTIGGAGGGGGGAVTVQVGPDFGDPSDGVTLKTNTTLTIDRIAVEGSLTSNATLTMDNVALVGNLTANGTLTLDNLALVGTLQCNGAFQNPEFTTSAIVAGRDSWWPDVATCPDDANKNGTALQVEGVTATKKACAMAWDLSGFPSNATVTSAIVRIVVSTVPTGAVNATDRVRLATQASEGWSETVIKCSSHPADDGDAANNRTVFSSVNGGAVGDVHSITLNSTARTRIQARMGTGTFTIIVDSIDNTTVNHAFWDKDTGAAADRPSLAVTFTTPK